MKSFSEIVQILKSKDIAVIAALSDEEIESILLTSDGAGKEVKKFALQRILKRQSCKAFNEWMRS